LNNLNIGKNLDTKINAHFFSKNSRMKQMDEKREAFKVWQLEMSLIF
jgi:hypothetical protein